MHILGDDILVVLDYFYRIDVQAMPTAGVQERYGIETRFVYQAGGVEDNLAGFAGGDLARFPLPDFLTVFGVLDALVDVFQNQAPLAVQADGYSFECRRLRRGDRFG